jgi:hypothetical protein
MQNQLTVGLFSKRLTLSTGLSLLLHFFVFFSLSLLLKMNTPAAKNPRVNILEVRFSHPAPPQSQPRPVNQLLTTAKPAPYKVDQANISKTPLPLPAETVIEQPAPAVEGVAFPAAIATPFQGQARSRNPFSLRAQDAQQNAARTYYQQTMAAQARQHTEFQAQLIVQQLQQILGKALDVEPLVTGKCMLVESAGDLSNRLKCDSSALYELLHKEQKDVAGMLIALRGMGRILNGFSAEKQAGKLGITLINEEGSTVNKTLEPDRP